MTAITHILFSVSGRLTPPCSSTRVADKLEKLGNPRSLHSVSASLPVLQLGDISFVLNNYVVTKKTSSESAKQNRTLAMKEGRDPDGRHAARVENDKIARRESTAKKVAALKKAGDLDGKIAATKQKRNTRARVQRKREAATIEAVQDIDGKIAAKRPKNAR